MKDLVSTEVMQMNRFPQLCHLRGCFFSVTDLTVFEMTKKIKSFWSESMKI